MTRQSTRPVENLGGLQYRPGERLAKASIIFRPLKASPTTRLITRAVIFALLIEFMTANRSSDPEGQIWAAVAANSGAVDSVLYLRDGKTLATVDSNGRAALWDVATGRRRDSQPERFCRIRSLAASPGGRILAGGDFDSTIILWDMVTLRVIDELRAHARPVRALAFASDSRVLASASGDGTLILWSMTADRPRICRRLASTEIASMAFSPDTASLATLHTTGEVRILAIDSPAVPARVVRFSPVPRAIAFSYDGRTLAASAMSSSRIMRWDLLGNRELPSLEGPVAGVPTIAFSPDGRILVSTGNDGTMQLSDLTTGQERAVITGHRGPVWSVAFSPDGHSIVTGGNDQRIRRWNLAKINHDIFTFHKTATP
jgi:WD40 repeat protein